MQVQANTVEVAQPRMNAKQITVLKSERKLKICVVTFIIILSKLEAAELCILLKQPRVYRILILHFIRESQ